MLSSSFHSTLQFDFSPRLSAREIHNKHHQNATPPVISLPKLKSVPNQVASTPRRLLQPIHNQGLSVQEEILHQGMVYT